MLLQQIIKEAEVLAGKCLSQPWETTEAELRHQLMQWHELLNQFSDQLNTVQSMHVQQHLSSLNLAVQHTMLALRSRDAVQLSNCLALEWIASLQLLQNT